MYAEDIETDSLVTSYYKHFHQFHPFLLPQEALSRIHKHANIGLDLTSVIAGMRLVGHLYAAQELSPRLKDHAETSIAQASPTSPVTVQSRLLYSIVLFWHNFKAQANREIRTAVKLAVDLKMFRQESASDHGAGDPVLMECRRRSWWMLYIVDAYYAGTLGTMNFSVFDIDATVDLPCEETEYESEVPKAHTYSARRATIGLHRPLSELKFNPVEGVSSCAREPPANNPTPDLINVHTVRVLRSIEAQIRLLALPARPFRHTPFVTCMVSEGTLALLSACAFQLSGKELAVARDQIRMTIGCLRDLGELWPRTASNVKEIQTIARHVLGLGGPKPRNGSRSTTHLSSNVPSLSVGESRGSLGSGSGEPSIQDGVLGSLGSIEDVCGWYNLSDLGPELEQWMGNGL
ncbi:C6 zinc finger protein [Diaporthe helianthi]|uniref:C6 zinc finger protein n=1 Tax=Diaporthe helianthi TaxID=158607 RepID=A0A2P5HIG3_DIAHE|nr:C6 zinc finger protein [Diaporthe helianthi]